MAVAASSVSLAQGACKRKPTDPGRESRPATVEQTNSPVAKPNGAVTTPTRQPPSKRPVTRAEGQTQAGTTENSTGAEPATSADADDRGVKYRVVDFDPELIPGAEPPDPNPTPFDELKQVTTDSGLKYWDIKIGEGEPPHPNANVKVTYRAWFPDGALFDSSAHKGYDPFFGRMGVIPGFYEGVWSMRVGGVRRLEIPPELAYGDEGSASRIPPGATLIFEVGLLEATTPPLQTSVKGIEPVISATGLKYWDIVLGEGAQPSPRADVTVHFSSWRADGALLRTTANMDTPVTFRVNRASSGWVEGLASMRVGGKRRLEIPPALGHRQKQTRIVEVELLDVKPPPPSRDMTSVAGIEPVTTPSGLTYWDIKVGEGRPPGPDAVVNVHFTYWLPDGRMIQCTREEGRPAVMPLETATRGLAEGIGSMNVGGKRRLEIPPELGYAEQGQPGLIPPNATLIVEVELAGFKAVP